MPVGLSETPAERTARVLRTEAQHCEMFGSAIFRQYLDDDQAAELDEAVAAAGMRASATARFAHVTLELVRGTPDTPVEVTTWPGGVRRRLGTAPPHCLPVTWAG
jgi:hypothetical protein